MDKPARKISRKKASQPARTARRPATRKSASATAHGSGTALRFTRITRSLQVMAPPDCDASVILKQVAHNKYRYYAYWLLVGRYDHDAMSVRYKYTGEDTVRCDIPHGQMPSSAALLSHLVKFLHGEGAQNDGPPVIIGKGTNP